MSRFLLLLSCLTIAAAAHSSTRAFAPKEVGVSRRLMQEGEKASGTCVCIFDFDLTLRVQNATGWDTGSPDSGGIVRKCKEYGYQVALASANCDRQKMELILPNHIDDDIFTSEWFESPAFQHCDHYKTNELNKILDFYDTPAACAMFFDDLEYNVRFYGQNVGVHWRHVNGEFGVTWDDFWALVPELKSKCDCV